MVRKSKQSTSEVPASNAELAAALEETANLLEAQGAGPFRVRAYRNAAQTLSDLPAPLWPTLESEGEAGLVRLPTIGRSIAATLAHLIRTGKFPLLERLRGENSAERLFATVADIGPKLAQRIHEHLGIETLDELQAAAADGRLAQVPGMGRKRRRAVRETLAGRFRGPPPNKSPRGASEMTTEAPIAELLDVDREYRLAAKAKRLPRIAPRRFNPTHEAWLPVLHTARQSRHYTAMFSNTARAHELDATHDWVVIYRDDEGDHGHWTVITSHFGKLRGKRIIRGHEPACALHYANNIADTADVPTRVVRRQRMLHFLGANDESTT